MSISACRGFGTSIAAPRLANRAVCHDRPPAIGGLRNFASDPHGVADASEVPSRRDPFHLAEQTVPPGVPRKVHCAPRPREPREPPNTRVVDALAPLEVWALDIAPHAHAIASLGIRKHRLQTLGLPRTRPGLALAGGLQAVLKGEKP